MVFENDIRHFLKELYFLEEQMNVQLFQALYATFVVFTHRKPLQMHSEHSENVIETVAQKHDEVKVLRPKRSVTVLLKYSVSKLNLITKFIVNFHESQN